MLNGHDHALSLASAGIETTVITDAAAWAVMARMNKVVLGVHAVLANGGIIAPAGTRIVALAAKAHHVPVVCCAGLWKLSPLAPFDVKSFAELQGPESLELAELVGVDGVDIVNPTWDYIEPEFVDLFVTNS